MIQQKIPSLKLEFGRKVKDLELYLMFRLGRIKCSKWLNLSSDNTAL
jgi:hypothetical protein